jgi:hypothetical protein
VLVGTGSNETRFTVHHDVILKRSAFFRAARSERWITDKSKPADLHEHNPETFNVYLHCLYHSVVPKSLNINAHDTRFKELIDLYALADILVDPTTANLVIDEIRSYSELVRRNPSAEAITYAFESTRDDDALRGLFADFCIYDGADLPEGNLPKEFLSLLVQRFLAEKDRGTIVMDNDQYECFAIVSGRDGWDDYDYYRKVEDDEE